MSCFGFETMPARLRMSVIAQPGVDKSDFELWSLAVSAINACGACIEAHDHALKHAGGPCCTDRSLGGEDWAVYQGPVSHPGPPPCHSKRTKIAVITSRSSGTE